jgi:UDP-N-acetylglucosamine--dolichyl-phosphate N-acetylglucosaminephosphotransferase
MVFALIAFLLFNRPPARIFPGDSLTYSVGAAIACIAITGNMEKLALLLFIPYFFDAAMFIRFRFLEKKSGIEAFAKANPDGSLELPHKNIYDFTHLALWFAKKVKKKVYEKDVVLTVLSFEIALALIGVSLWYFGVV